jgi:hypothetical protein
MRNQLKGHGDDAHVSRRVTMTPKVSTFAPPKNDGAVLSNGFRVLWSPSYFHFFPDCAIENRFNEPHLSSLGRRAHAHAPLGQSAKKKDQQHESSREKVIYLFMLGFQESNEKITVLSFPCLLVGSSLRRPSLTGFIFCPDRLPSMSWPIFSGRIASRISDQSRGLCISSIIQGCVDASTCLVIE